MITQYEYYKNEDVRQRLYEYCSSDYKFSSEYLVGYGQHLDSNYSHPFLSVNNSDFHWILDNSMDIFRSYWDKKGTLFLLDIEYYNLDFGGNIYLKPQICFEKIEPVYQIIKKLFKRYGIPFFAIMTGQGYHFCSKIPSNSKIHGMVERIGCIAEELQGKYSSTSQRRKKKVPKKYGLAYDGVGKLLEFLYHQVRIESKKAGNILPIHMGDIATKDIGFGREGISIDLTCFSDPLFMRDIRLPFSTHQKHKIQKYKVGDEISNNIPIQISLPRTDNISLDELIEIRRHFKKSADYAKSISCSIPSIGHEFEKLIKDYKNSELFKFHRDFDSVSHDHYTNWHETYDKFDTNSVPPCLSNFIHEPNPNLLKPTVIQHLTRVLLALDWHPKHIAGLLRSKYERNYNWDTDWGKYDATTRANFWIRIYAGLIYNKIDSLNDFNCSSHQEKGFCTQQWCGYDLNDYKKKIENI